MNSNPMYMEYVDDADPQPARRRGWRILGWISIGLSVVMVAGALTTYGLYRNALGNIGTEDLNGNIGPRPKKLNSAMNILVLGSDTRDGANAKYGRAMKGQPPRSDTMILLHLSPGGQQVMGISFPRDLMIPLPSCKTLQGGVSPRVSRGQINSTFTVGGASCVVKTIESVSNIKIDHFVEINFTGVKSITKAVGGVWVCLPKAVNDPKAHLNLPAGRQKISGEAALGYVRTRYSLGDGSDTDRIKRQQKFIASLANEVLKAGTLSNPGKVLGLVNATTKSMRTDKELTPDVMLDLASSMQKLSSGKIRFVTVPSGPDPLDPNRIALRPEASQFFSAIRNDKAVPAEAPKPKDTQPKIPAEQVRVRVFNGSGTAGLASRVAGDLRSRGFQVVKTGNTPAPSPTTKVMFGTGADRHAETLNELLVKAPKPTPRTDGLPGVVDLVLGADFTELKNTKSGIPKQQGEVRADQDPCKAP